MTVTDLVVRLAALPHMGEVPRDELEWLVTHGTFEAHDRGFVIGAKGKRIEKLWLVISGRVEIRVDRGAGPRLVTEWQAGEVTGMLPYSRMQSPPGDNYCAEASEFLTVHQKHFPEMVYHCPTFTAYTVHTMLDRARNFNTSALQDEKMVSLGKLAAGLAHELNNPASATKRGATALLEDLSRLDDASRALNAARLTDEQLDAIERARRLCLTRYEDGRESPLDRADREDALADWLAAHRAGSADAGSLVDTAVTTEALDALARTTPFDTLETVLRWMAARCATHALATDIERAATRIYELVAAVKQFTHMDHLAGPESVEVEAGIRDAMSVLESKAKAKHVSIALDVESHLPRARATSAELNQVWFSLIDNALDAVPESGHIGITARSDLDHVAVSVIDDGPGIPGDVLPQIFDPFFTTKPPGQGTGLGLDMTRRLVRRYRGDISVESRPGRTEVHVRLPAEKHAPTGEHRG